MVERGSTHTEVSFVVPGAGDAFRARHPALFAALAQPGFGVSVLSVVEGEQSMEQALFALANELRESDVIVLVDERSAAYDPSRPGQAISPLNLAAVATAEWLGRPFGRVFRMLVYARRPE